MQVGRLFLSLNSIGTSLTSETIISDAPKLDCPACGEPALKKQVSAVAFRLKGSGWYETDFKTGDKKNLAGDEKKKASPVEKPATSKKTDTKTDSKKSSTA